MKTKIVVSVLLGCSLLSTSLTAVAQGNRGFKGLANIGEPRMDYDAKFAMEPLADAPPEAMGKARLKFDGDDGSEGGTLKLQIHGLAPGEYVVYGVRASDGTWQTVGFITVEEQGTNGIANGKSNGKGKDKNKGKTEGEFQLPPEIDPMNLREVIVSATGGTVLLIGDLTEDGGKSKANLRTAVPLTAGPAASDATGFASLRSKIRKGERKDNFILLASDVPADSTFTVLVDGADAGTVDSNSKGLVLLRKLPEDLVTIGSVVLVNSNTVEVVRADF